MKKEIGGYLELEESTGRGYYPELFGVNLGRTALLWLMEARNCKKIYLPTYLCDSVTGACEKTEAEIEFYHMDEKLRPLFPEKKLPEGEYYYSFGIDDLFGSTKYLDLISFWVNKKGKVELSY